MTIEFLHPDELRNHTVNLSIYGDIPDPEFVASVKAHGIFDDHPIGYVMDGDFRVIVSGHRRNQAAKLAKLDMVPVIRLTEIEGDELAIKERIILSNTQRVKTTEQKAREAALLADIESVRAEQRKQENLKNQEVSSTVSDDTVGKTRQKVADALAVSEATAQRLITAGQALDAAEQNGQYEKAAEIKLALTNGAAAGARAANPKPPQNGSVIKKFNEKALQKHLTQLRQMFEDRHAAHPGHENQFRAVKKAFSALVEEITTWRELR